MLEISLAMDDFFEILKLLLPALLVFLTTFYMLKKFLDNEDKKRLMELKQEGHKFVTPIRFQAYERMILFLERISPENLLMRVHKPGMNARIFQAELLQTIRTEFEHNISQQIYISNSGWDLVKRSKEETIKIINIASSKVNDNSSGLDLSKVIFKIITELGKVPTQVAVDFLKKEIRQSF